MGASDYPAEARDRLHVMPGMEVFDASGHKVGAVAHVLERVAGVTGSQDSAAATSETVMEVQTGIFGLGRHYYIPVSAVADVTAGGAFLRKTQAEFDAAWRK